MSNKQPNTELEYQFQKTRRHLTALGGLIIASMFASVAVLLLESEPVMAFGIGLSAYGCVFITSAAIEEGVARRAINWLPGDDIEEIKRPDEQASGSEVVADD